MFVAAKAVPRIQATAKIKLSHTDRMLFPCVFTAARKTSDADGILYGPIIWGGTKMTPKQFFTRLRTWLKAVTWEDSPGGKIFGESVYVVPKIPIEQISVYRPPAVFIVDKGASMDKDHPGLLVQSFSLSIFQEKISDHMTEDVLLGSMRQSGTSSGAGILDIEEELIPKIIDTTVLTTKILLVEKSIPQVTTARGNNPLSFRALNFTVLLSLY